MKQLATITPPCVASKTYPVLPPGSADHSASLVGGELARRRGASPSCTSCAVPDVTQAPLSLQVGSQVRLRSEYFPGSIVGGGAICAGSSGPLTAKARPIHIIDI